MRMSIWLQPAHSHSVPAVNSTEAQARSLTPNNGPDEIRSPRWQILEAIAPPTRGSEPELECCGLLAGRNGVISRDVARTKTRCASATAYEIAPQELFAVIPPHARRGPGASGHITTPTCTAKTAPSPSDIARSLLSRQRHISSFRRSRRAKSGARFPIPMAKRELKIEVTTGLYAFAIREKPKRRHSERSEESLSSI